MLAPPSDVTARLAASLHPADMDRGPAEFRRLVEHRLKGVGYPFEVETQCPVEGGRRMRVLRIKRTPNSAMGEWTSFLLWTKGNRVLAQEFSTGSDFETGWMPIAWRKAGGAPRRA